MIIGEDLGGEILGRAHKASGLLASRHILLREAKVGQDGVALGINHHVFRLQTRDKSEKSDESFTDKRGEALGKKGTYSRYMILFSWRYLRARRMLAA